MQENNSFKDKIRHLLEQVSLQTYFYAILAIGAIILIVSNARLTNKTYVVNKNSSTECKDPHGRIIEIDPSNGEACVNIFGAAKDYGIDLSYINQDNSITENANSINTNTFDLSKDIVLTNLYLEQNNVTDPVEKGKVFAKIITDYKNQITSDTYTLDNLNTKRPENAKSYKEYYDAFTKVCDDYNNKIKSSENNNLEELTKINDSFIQDLLAVQATSVGGKYQIELINLIANQNKYLSSLKNIDTDPNKFLVLGGEGYTDTFSKKIEAVNSNIKKYFSSVGIKQ
ncbi:MAG: hypothetical protein KBD12_00505 [Candidatus Pacebacteria bacterium]|nr:hypothetical protein [Candidatus Paceibacterota bacterium]